MGDDIVQIASEEAGVGCSIHPRGTNNQKSPCRGFLVWIDGKKIFPLSQHPSDEDNKGYDEQGVDQVSAHMEAKPEKPQYHEDYNDCSEHICFC